MSKSKTFVVYRRNGAHMVPHPARIEWSADGTDWWVQVCGPAIQWSELYGGHTAWVGEQVARVREAVKRERARRNEKRVRDAVQAAPPMTADEQAKQRESFARGMARGMGASSAPL